MKQSSAAALSAGTVLLAISIPVLGWWIPLAAVASTGTFSFNVYGIAALEGFAVLVAIYLVSGLLLYYAFQGLGQENR